LTLRVMQVVTPRPVCNATDFVFVYVTKGDSVRTLDKIRKKDLEGREGV